MIILSCTLRDLPPRSVLICQSFHHPKLTLPLFPRPSRKILKDLAKMSHSYLIPSCKIFWTFREFFEKIGPKEIMFTSSSTPTTLPTSFPKYVRVCHYNILYNSVGEIYKNNSLSFNNFITILSYINSTII